MSNAPQPAVRPRSRSTAGNEPAAFGRIHESAAPRTDAPDFAEIQRSEEFRALRRRAGRFVFSLTALFLVWYVGYVLLAAYAHDFMATELLGSINVGLVLGLLQFVSTLVITGFYVRYAERNIDPQVDEIRQKAGVDPA